MKRIAFLLGAGVGFVLGFKTAQGPYPTIEAKVREVTKRPKPGTGAMVTPPSPPPPETALAEVVPLTDPLSSGDDPVDTQTSSTPETSGTQL
jgi:hypothetical protein